MPSQQGIESIMSGTRTSQVDARPQGNVPSHLRGLLEHADSMRPQEFVLHPSAVSPLAAVKIVAADGSKIRTNPEVLNVLTRDVRDARTFGSFVDAARALPDKLRSTGVFSKVDCVVTEHDGVSANRNAADLIVAVKESTVSGSIGSEYTASGQATFAAEVVQQAKAGICNLLGLADTLSIDFAGAPTSLNLTDLSKLGDSPGAMVAGALQPSFTLSYSKPTFFGGFNPVELKLRTFSDRIDSTVGFSTKTREIDANISDSSLRHSLSYCAAWRNVVPLPDPDHLFASSSSNAVVADSSASLKSAVSYSYLRNKIAGSQLPASGSKLAFTIEGAGLGGDVQHVKVQTGFQVAASFGRYMPDTGFQSPISRSLWLAETERRLSKEDAAALGFQRAHLKVNPQHQNLYRFADRSAPSSVLHSLGEGSQTPANRAELFLTSEKGVKIAHSPGNLTYLPKAGYTIADRLRGWLGAGVTCIVDGRVGGIWGYGNDAFRASGTRVCDKFYLTSQSIRGFESVGPKAEKKPLGTPYGDALGGDIVAAFTARLLFPPPIPSVRLTNAGMRTQLFAAVGSLNPSFGGKLEESISASAGVGLITVQVLPIAQGVSLEMNYAMWHSKKPADIASALRLQLMV